MRHQGAIKKQLPSDTCQMRRLEVVRVDKTKQDNQNKNNNTTKPTKTKTKTKTKQKKEEQEHARAVFGYRRHFSSWVILTE